MRDYTYTLEPISEEEIQQYPIYRGLSRLSTKAIKGKTTVVLYDSTWKDKSEAKTQFEPFTIGSMTLKVRRDV
jgi:hypothetical protein